MKLKQIQSTFIEKNIRLDSFKKKFNLRVTKQFSKPQCDYRCGIKKILNLSGTSVFPSYDNIIEYEARVEGKENNLEYEQIYIDLREVKNTEE